MKGWGFSEGAGPVGAGLAEGGGAFETVGGWRGVAYGGRGLGGKDLVGAGPAVGGAY